MLIDGFLDDILRDCTPDDRAFQIATERADRVGRVLANDRRFAVKEYEVGGSCGKQTALSPIGDVDLFVYLDPDEWMTTSGEPKQPATVLGEFHRQRVRLTLVG